MAAVLFLEAFGKKFTSVGRYGSGTNGAITYSIKSISLLTELIEVVSGKLSEFPRRLSDELR